MPKFRDAETGEYISEEEAQKRSPATWVKENDSGSQQGDLKEIYDRCVLSAVTPAETEYRYNSAMVPLGVIRDILNDYGANIKDD